MSTRPYISSLKALNCGLIFAYLTICVLYDFKMKMEEEKPQGFFASKDELDFRGVRPSIKT